MKVTLDQCSPPKCKGCGKHLGHDHESDCLIKIAHAFKAKSSELK